MNRRIRLREAFALAAIAIAVAVVPAAIAAPTSSAAERLRCGTVSRDYPYGEGGSSVFVEAVNLSCRAARRVTAVCIVHQQIPNWRVIVSNRDARAALVRDGKRIVMHFRAGGPPFCT